jgi:GT2 family glycosyltransferase
VDLSVVIVNWNTREHLRECLASLNAALPATGWASEVIVVDNASVDGSAEMVRAMFPEVDLIANPENLNYAAGSNQALRKAAGRFILLLNPDTQVPPGAAEALVRLLDENPGAGAVAPALVHHDGRVQTSVRGFPTPRALVGDLTGLARLLPRGGWATYRARDLPADRPSSVEQPMASAFLLRKAALDEVGLFDESFPLFFNDVDFCYRLKQAGWEILYDPRVRVLHEGGASTRQVRPQAILASHAALRRFYDRHYRSGLPRPLYAALVISIQLAGRLRAGLAGLRARPAKAARTAGGADGGRNPD